MGKLEMGHRIEVYEKTRPKPSSQSTHRIASVDVEACHPLLRKYVAEWENQLNGIRKEVHAYHPSATIWEMQHNKEQSAVGERRASDR